MTRVDWHYVFLAGAAITAFSANRFWTQLAGLEPWLSLGGVAAVVWVVRSIFTVEKRSPDAVTVRRLAGQKKVILAWIVTDVLSVFQWLLHFKRLWLGVSVNDLLALLTLLGWTYATVCLSCQIARRIWHYPPPSETPASGDGTNPAA